MSIIYIPEGLEGTNRKYSMSYTELRDQYRTFLEKTDDEFMALLPDAIHLAVVICYLKEIPNYICLSDVGIIHELVHLLKEHGTTTSLEDIRKLFKEQLKLD